MGMLQEFKKFALRGNVIDMAVGIIIGAAFSTVVKSLVDDVVMPPIGYVTNGIDFKNLSYELKAPVTRVENGVVVEVLRPAVVLRYGSFINNVITFLIVAWAVFILVKGVNTAESKLFRGEQPPEATPPPSEEIVLLREIRDALKRSPAS
jgi:large conductance mechanosensitive channel